MSQNRWTAEQDQYLIDHWQSQSDSELAEMVGHTAASVNARRQRLGLKHRESSKGPDWSREEVELMQELWGTYTIPQIAKRLNRSVLAVKVKSGRLGLGRYVNSSQYITANQAAVLLQVDIHTVTDVWIPAGLRFTWKARRESGSSAISEWMTCWNGLERTRIAGTVEGWNCSLLDLNRNG